VRGLPDVCFFGDDLRGLPDVCFFGDDVRGLIADDKWKPLGIIGVLYLGDEMKSKFVYYIQQQN
jgi:hypothetical protein